MLDRDVARILTTQELENYESPAYYVSHHGVMKESSSTPGRIVFNSSANFRDHVLNDYWAKGPNLINNLVGILIRFREEAIGIIGDIRKIYHTIKIGLLDQHTHRFLWRNMESWRHPDTYVMTSVSFGDRPSGNIAIGALYKTAKMNALQFPEAAKAVEKCTYVDDIIDSLNDQSAAKKRMRDVDELIGKGGFVIKEWIVSLKGEDSQITSVNDIKTFSNHKVLGLVWKNCSDYLKYQIKLNLSPKKRGIYTEPEIQKLEVPDKIPKLITKRMLLSQINKIYDPLGLITPFTIKAKILIKSLWKKGLDWDEDFAEDDKACAVEFLVNMFQLEDI